MIHDPVKIVVPCAVFEAESPVPPDRNEVDKGPTEAASIDTDRIPTNDTNKPASIDLTTSPSIDTGSVSKQKKFNVCGNLRDGDTTTRLDKSGGKKRRNWKKRKRIKEGSQLSLIPHFSDGVRKSRVRSRYFSQPFAKLREGSNLNYVIMAEDEQDELPEATQREVELQRQIDGLQSQVTELHKTREEANPELSSEFQSLKEKLKDHYKELKQSSEMLSQLESENLNLRDENQALNTVSKKKGRFRAQVRPMPTLETPNSGTGANLPPTAEMRQCARRLRRPRSTTWKIANLNRNPIRKHLVEQRKRSLPWSLTWNRCSPIGSMPCSPW
ncbi:hypothetical protein F2Q68_00010436 [Brassica cretica]|uniref:Uncharacterized protein n=1 Tax=Brassica cretica TaxID=69181 RepID=A0A8S9KMN7_BRACR|nr:hypothetical protein F2Q68_00010436 [Brassica cretica]